MPVRRLHLNKIESAIEQASPRHQWRRSGKQIENWLAVKANEGARQANRQVPKLAYRRNRPPALNLGNKIRQNVCDLSSACNDGQIDLSASRNQG
jgi:hypothetical protein